jgi:hypothetical protein
VARGLWRKLTKTVEKSANLRILLIFTIFCDKVIGQFGMVLEGIENTERDLKNRSI